MPNGIINAASASIGIIDANFIEVGTIRPTPGQNSVNIIGDDPCCVYTTGSTGACADIRTGSIMPKNSTHVNQGCFSVINGGDLNRIGGVFPRVMNVYNGIHAGYDNTMENVSGSVIGGGLHNDVFSSLGVIGGGKCNQITGNSLRSGILGGFDNCIKGHEDAFIVGSNIISSGSCTTHVNYLNIQDIDFADLKDRLLVRHSSGLVRQGPSILEIDVDGVIQVPGLANPDRDVYVTGSVGSSSIQPFFTNHGNYGYFSVIGGGDNNCIVDSLADGTPYYDGIFSGKDNCILDATSTFIGGGLNNFVDRGEGDVIAGGICNSIVQSSGIFTPVSYSAILSGRENTISGSSYSAIESGYENIIKMTGSLSGSVPYSDEYGFYNNILTGISGTISQSYPSEQFYVASTLGTSLPNSQSVFGGFIYGPNYIRDLYGVRSETPPPFTFIPRPFSNREALFIEDLYQEVDWSGFISPLLTEYAGTHPLAKFTPKHYNNVIISGKDNFIKDLALHNVILGGHHNYIQSQFFGTGGNNAVPNCTGNDIRIAYAERNAVLAGEYNAIWSAYDSVVGGGQNNVIRFNVNTPEGSWGLESKPEDGITHPARSFIGAGYTNTIGWSTRGFIGAGGCNEMTGRTIDGAIVSGYCNLYLVGNQSIIGGGRENIMCLSNCAVIGGGHLNTITYNNHSAILGGKENCIKRNACESFIGGGRNNIIDGPQSSIVGGGHNSILRGTNTTRYKFIGGGYCNTVKSSFSAILGGCCNCVQHAQSFIVGANITSTAECTTYVNNLDSKDKLQVTGSALFTLTGIPIGNSGLSTGQLYRTGSANDEIRIKL